jgi:chemotaxis signal transduction protein
MVPLRDLKLFFGKDENRKRKSKNPQLVIAVKSSSSFIGFFIKPLTPSLLSIFLT